VKNFHVLIVTERKNNTTTISEYIEELNAICAIAAVTGKAKVDAADIVKIVVKYYD